MEDEKMELNDILEAYGLDKLPDELTITYNGGDPAITHSGRSNTFPPHVFNRGTPTLLSLRSYAHYSVANNPDYLKKGPQWKSEMIAKAQKMLDIDIAFFLMKALKNKGLWKVDLPVKEDKPVTVLDKILPKAAPKEIEEGPELEPEPEPTPAPAPIVEDKPKKKKSKKKDKRKKKGRR